jgi:hypothetical protein
MPRNSKPTTEPPYPAPPSTKPRTVGDIGSGRSQGHRSIPKSVVGAPDCPSNILRKEHQPVCDKVSCGLCCRQNCVGSVFEGEGAAPESEVYLFFMRFDWTHTRCACRPLGFGVVCVVRVAWNANFSVTFSIRRLRRLAEAVRPNDDPCTNQRPRSGLVFWP